MSERAKVLKEVLSWVDEGWLIKRIEEAIEAEEPEPWPVLPAGIPCETYTDNNARLRLRYHCGNGVFSKYRDDAHPGHSYGFKYPHFRPACLPDWSQCLNDSVWFLVMYALKGGYLWGWWKREPTRTDDADVVYYEPRP